MIELTDSTRMRCDNETCNESLRVTLVLLPTGGFGVKIPQHAVGKWQLLVDRQNPMAPYKVKCPEHSQSRIVVPQVGGLTQ